MMKSSNPLILLPIISNLVVSNIFQQAIIAHWYWMGSQQSQEYQNLVFPLEQNQYSKLEDRGDFHIWEDKISTRKFMVYPTLHWEALSQHNLQVYHFRKLNRAYLAGIHGILKEDSNICTKNSNSWVMVEHLPYSLADFSRKLSRKETISLLQALLAGYRLMSYIFGPLIATEERVFFTQIGVPKVWANQRLNLNEPSQSCHYHTMDTRDSSLSQGQNITDRRSKSIRSIVRVVSNNSEQGLPKKLENELKCIKSYEEGQEIIQMYCKSNRIEIDETICMVDKTSKLTLNKSAMSKLSFSSDSSKPVFSRIPSYAPYSNMNFQRPEQHQPRTFYHPPRIIPQLSINHVQAGTANRLYNTPQITQPLINMSNSPVITPQSVVTQTIITSIPTEVANGRSQLYRVQLPPYFENRLSEKPINETLKLMRQPQNILNDHLNLIPQARLPNVEIVLSQQTQSSISKQLIRQERQESHIADSIENNSLEENIQNQNQLEQYQIRGKNSQVYHSNDLNGQEDEQNQNLDEQGNHSHYQRPHIKVSYQSSENYRSEERDQVILPQLNTRKQSDNIQNFKSEQQLQKYVRDKYSEYFQEEKSNKLHTASQQKQDFQKKVTFSQKILMQVDRDQEEQELQNKEDQKDQYFFDNDIKKITFGNIDSKRQIKSKYDYIANASNLLQLPYKSEKVEKNINPSNYLLNQKYSKYVLNKNAINHQKRGDAFQKSIFNKQFDFIRQKNDKRYPY